jgi:hypothetical protein
MMQPVIPTQSKLNRARCAVPPSSARAFHRGAQAMTCRQNSRKGRGYYIGDGGADNDILTCESCGQTNLTIAIRADDGVWRCPACDREKQDHDREQAKPLDWPRMTIRIQVPRDRLARSKWRK